jgi:hypothetical protein
METTNFSAPPARRIIRTPLTLQYKNIALQLLQSRRRNRRLVDAINRHH